MTMARAQYCQAKKLPEASARLRSAPIYRLRVRLAEVEPPVWRRIRVLGDLPLGRLHDVFQCAMGWQDAHLHEWTLDAGLP